MLQKIHIWSPIFIAFCALVVSINEGYQTRVHNKTSVKPHVSLNFEYTLEGGAGWKYSNFGLGPAIIKSFKVSVDGNQYHNWDSVIRTLGIVGGGQNVPGVEVRVFRTGTIINPNESKKMLWIRPGEFSQALISNYSRVEFNTCYCSLYDECWSVGTKNIEPISVGSCESESNKFGLSDIGP